MAVKYVKDFSFPASGGFHSSSVQRYAKGGHVTKVPAKAAASAKGMPARAKPNAPARGAPKMESKPKMGKGQGYERGGRVPGREMDRLPTKKPPGRGMDLAPARRFKGAYQGYAEGGPVDPYDPEIAKYNADFLRNLKNQSREQIPFPQDDSEIIVDDFGPKGYPDEMPPMPVAPPSDIRVRPAEGAPPLMPPPEMPPKAKDDHPYREDFGLPLEFAPAPSLSRAELMALRREMMGDRREMMMRPGVRSAMRRVAPRSRMVDRSEPQPTMMRNPRYPEIGMYAKGGKVEKVMREYKEGKLHSGSKKGPVVKGRKQAIAIALSEARKAGEKVAKKADGGGIFSTEYLAYGDKKVPYRGSPKKAKMLGRQDRRAREAMERAEKYAPGLSLDMPDGKMSKYAKGGKAKHEDVKMDKAMMKSAVHKHEKAMHPGKPLTKLKKGGVPAYGAKPMYGGGKC
jgi:hypothetical protein